MKKFIFTMGFTALLNGAALNAQVTIGKDKSPESFSVLELISNSTRGLRLPQLTTTQRDVLTQTQPFIDEKTDKARGLTIFNIFTRCVETWNGLEWIQKCDGEPLNPQTTGVAASSCEVNTVNNLTFTAIADHNACGYEFFVDNASQGYQVSNNITFDAAPDKIVSVKYYFDASLLKPKMISVAGGSYTIGATVQSDNDGQGGNGAASGSHSVKISNFKISETPITQAQFDAVFPDRSGVNNGYSATQPCDNYFTCSNNPVYAPSSAKPAEMVNWYDAIAYCNKLSAMEGKDPVYTVSGISNWGALTYAEIPSTDNTTWNNATQNLSAEGYRLPTEAEWEYAARGGQLSLTITSGGSTLDYYYSGSNTAVDVAWYDGNDGSIGNADFGTKAVKQKYANVLGLYDMSGNVWEWCWDWYVSTIPGYTNDTDPTGPASGTTRVIRGCCWYYSAYYCRVSDRNSDAPYRRYNGFGFRIVFL